MTVEDDDNIHPSSGLFRQCDPDPKGSVSKAWSLSLLFILIFFGFSIYEGEFQTMKSICCRLSVVKLCTHSLFIFRFSRLDYCHQLHSDQLARQRCIVAIYDCWDLDSYNTTWYGHCRNIHCKKILNSIFGRFFTRSCSVCGTTTSDAVCNILAYKIWKFQHQYDIFKLFIHSICSVQFLWLHFV